MNDLSPLPVTSADEPARRKWPAVVLVLVLLLLCMLVGSWISLRNTGRGELREAIAEVERREPRWRLEDVEADRAVVPEERNSAVTAMAVKLLLPPKWPVWEQRSPPVEDHEAEAKRAALEASFQNLEPQWQLNAEQIEALQTELARAEAAVVQARKLAELTEGRYPIHYSADAISTLLPHLQDTRDIASRLLSYDVLLRAQEEDAEQALTSCRAIVNAGRSIGDEPTLVSQLVRISIRSIAVGKVQRTLAQGQPSEAALWKLQQLLEKEETEPLLLIGMRGERGGMDRLLSAIESGMTTLDPVLGGPSRMEALAARLPGVMQTQRAAMLRYMTRAVEIAKLPPEQQQHEMKQLEATAQAQPFLVRMLVPAIGKVVAAGGRSRMELRCAVVAVAAERYRRAKKRWPDNLEALCEAGYLGRVPTDLYDGKPVRLLRLDDGLLIYSVGTDGEDNGGNLDPRQPMAKVTDVGFRLWDADKRRQPPAPKPRPPDADMPPGLVLPP